jgi:uncharacterized membrane protein YjgN (DUF898 family)
MKKSTIKFTGGFGEYFLMNLGLTVLSIVTLGIGSIYQIYWNAKYFVSKLEIIEG